MGWVSGVLGEGQGRGVSLEGRKEGGPLVGEGRRLEIVVIKIFVFSGLGERCVFVEWGVEVCVNYIP